MKLGTLSLTLSWQGEGALNTPHTILGLHGWMVLVLKYSIHFQQVLQKGISVRLELWKTSAQYNKGFKPPAKARLSHQPTKSLCLPNSRLQGARPRVRIGCLFPIYINPKLQKLVLLLTHPAIGAIYTLSVILVFQWSFTTSLINEPYKSNHHW